MSWYRKGKTNLDFTEARDSEWQWHQLGHMQACTSLQTDNHASNPPLSFFTGWMPFLPPNQQRQSTEGKTQLTDQLTIINRRRGGISGWDNDRLCLASSYNTEAINGNRNTVKCRYCYAGRVSYSGKSYTSVWCLSVPSATHQGHH